MAAIPLEEEIDYPDSDGEPMAETELHLEEMVYLRSALKKRFQEEPDVYVAGNLLFYFRRGDRQAVVAPDVFVVKGVPKRLPDGRLRRRYCLWEEEGKAPCFVGEVTSDSTRAKDMTSKMDLYARLGVEEYFLFDPLGEYLRPRLQGYRLVRGRYRRCPPAADGSLLSSTTGLLFRTEGDRIRLIDPATGSLLLREEEEVEARRQAEERITAAEERAEAAEERNRALEAELARLRSRLG